MDVENIVTDITKRLETNIDLEYKQGQYRYHAIGWELLGVKTAIVRSIASDITKQIKLEKEEDVYLLIETLLKLKLNEYIVIGFQIASKLTKNLQNYHFDIFESWIENYIVDWGQCDDLSCGILGKLLDFNPKLIDKSLIWTESTNIWFKRASAVSLIYSLRKGHNLDQALKVANILLHDTHDMVQKGYGWMLKEASKQFQQEIFEFVMDNKSTMPRTALRYAIEKMPKELKQQAMI